MTLLLEVEDLRIDLAAAESALAAVEGVASASTAARRSASSANPVAASPSRRWP